MWRCSYNATVCLRSVFYYTIAKCFFLCKDLITIAWDTSKTCNISLKILCPSELKLQCLSWLYRWYLQGVEILGSFPKIPKKVGQGEEMDWSLQVWCPNTNLHLRALFVINTRELSYTIFHEAVSALCAKVWTGWWYFNLQQRWEQKLVLWLHLPSNAVKGPVHIAV